MSAGLFSSTIVLAVALAPMFWDARPQGNQTFTARDSAGVRIVENVRAERDSIRAWRLGAEPALVIGADAREAEYQFTQIVRVARFSSGQIAVANSPTVEIRVFSPAGRFVRRVGRRGTGPGEFYRDFDSVDMCASDTLYVQLRNYTMLATADTVLGRISVLTPDGIRPPGHYACGRGRVLWSLPEANAPLPRPGFSVRHANVRIATTAGQWLGAPGSIEAGDVYTPVTTGAEVRSFSVPFSRRFSAAFSSRGLYVQNSRVAEITQYNDAGTQVMQIRVRQPVRSATAAMRGEVSDSMLASRSSLDLPAYRRMFDDPQLPTTVPAFAAMIADDDDNLWVREYDEADMLARSLHSNRPRRWAVFAPDGHLVTYVNTPARFTPHQIGRDYMLGVWLDADDAPQVHMYRVSK